MVCWPMSTTLTVPCGDILHTVKKVTNGKSLQKVRVISQTLEPLKSHTNKLPSNHHTRFQRWHLYSRVICSIIYAATGKCYVSLLPGNGEYTSSVA